MPVDRPTFSESWYRVANLCPRLLTSVRTHRQHFRGQMWHVLQDPSNNQFFRLTESAYRFVGLLDGRRTVAQAWQMCNEQLGDSAPTQGEAIQLLGQLYSFNLLQADLPPDCQGLFERYRKRRSREVRGYLANLLFARIPLLDPDRFLERWLGVFGRVFSWAGFALWAALLAVGAYFAFSNYRDLADQTAGILSSQRLLQNLPLMFACFWAVKIIHEFGHGFACKKFGRSGGTGGEVHAMGIMFLVFTPIPYVDASSASAFRSKWQRAMVGAAGMYVELAVAAVAAIVWAGAAGDTMAKAVAYNVMFIASVSTLLFNANPLLRYDGYYILSDLLEIPNLAHRSKEYLQYLVRKGVWRVRQARDPAHTVGERAWFVFYGIASTIYRTVIVVAILLFVASALPVVGAALAIAAAAAWLVTPAVKFVHYLATSGELARVRAWAVSSVLVVACGIVAAVGLIPARDYVRAEGVSEPVDLAIVHVLADGFIECRPDGSAAYAACGQRVRPDGPPLLEGVNRDLSLELAKARFVRTQHEYRARSPQTAVQQAAQQAIAAQDVVIGRFRQELADLAVRAPLAGTWIAPGIERVDGAYLKKGQALGQVASDDVFIRAMLGQDEAALIIDEAASLGELPCEIRVRGRPDLAIGARPIRTGDILPAGTDRLPSAALGYLAGGSFQTDPSDRDGTKTTERLFEARIHLPRQEGLLLSGQRVAIRVELSRKPLASQWKRSLLQLLHRKFGM